MRFALWGLGTHAKKNIIPALIKSEGIIFQGIYSRNKDAVSELLSQYDCRTWNSSDEMLEDSEIDAIFLSTPPGLHFEQGMKILESDKHLFCEKPLTTNYDQTLLLLEKAASESKIIFEAFMFLYHPQFLKIQELVNLEKNNLEKIEVQFELPELESPGYRYSSNLGGSCLYDVGSYTVQTIMELFQNENIILVDSKVETDPVSEVDYSGEATYIVNNHIKCALKWSYNSVYKNEICFKTSSKEYFSDKIFSKDQNYFTKIDIKSRYTNLPQDQIRVGASNHFVGMLEFVIRNSSSQETMKVLSERIRHLAVRLREIQRGIF